MHLWCLHGNLQLPSAWAPFQHCWKAGDSPLQLNAVNLWKDLYDGLHDWTQTFCTDVQTEFANTPHWLLGYSMGGRLALHAALKHPELWNGVIVAGAHPGLSSPAEKSAQLERDRAWARRFLNEPWNDVLAAWDALPVFCGRPNTTPRPEHAFSRERLAHCFDVFSKGRQENLRPALSKIERPPILYVTGEEDVKYSQLANELAAICPAITHISIPGAGHRVPWEAPDAFASTVQAFIGS